MKCDLESQAAHCPPGTEPNVRYLELLTEAAYAEEMGFDFYSIPEQHFNTGRVPSFQQPISFSLPLQQEQAGCG